MKPREKGAANERELEAAVEEYYDAVWSFSLFLTGHVYDAAEEITQETFLCLIKKWNGIEKENVGRWLFGVARRKFYEYVRAQKRDKDHLIYPDDPEDPVFSAGEICVDDAIPDEAAVEEAKRRVVESLTDEEKILFDRYYGKKMTYAEIMKASGLSYNGVRMRLFRLRRKIKEKCKEEYR